MAGGMFGGLGYEPLDWQNYETPLPGSTIGPGDTSYSNFNQRFDAAFPHLSTDNSGSNGDNSFVPLPQPRPASADSSSGFLPSGDTSGVTSSDNSGIGNPAGDFNPFATNPVTGQNTSTPTGTTGSTANFDIAGWIERAFIFLLGAIFIIGGLFLFAKEQGINPAALNVLAKARA